MYTYIINQKRFLTCRAIGGSKTNTFKDSAWHIYRRTLLSLVQNDIITDSSILQHQNLHAKPHGTLAGIFAFVCQCISLASVISFAALLPDQPEEAPHTLLSGLFVSQDLGRKRTANNSQGYSIIYTTT